VTDQEANDGAWFWLGQGAFDTCSGQYDDNTYDEILLGARSSGSFSSYVYLEAGTYYPIRVVYINLLTEAVLQFQIVQPNGDIDDFSNVVNFSPNDEEACVSLTYGQKLYISTTYNFVDGPIATSYAQLRSQTAGGYSDYVVEQINAPQPTVTVTTTSYGKTESE